MKTIKVLIIGLSLCICAASAFALNLQWLQYNPVAYFNEEDWHILRETARDAFANLPDGESKSWENPNSGNSGTITVLKTFHRDGEPCRRAKIFNQAYRGVTGQTVANFCKNAEGLWRVRDGG